MNEQNQINQQNTSHDHNDHTTSSLIHLSSLASLIKFAIPIPFLSILFPLVLWQSLKKESKKLPKYKSQMSDPLCRYSVWSHKRRPTILIKI